MNKHIFFLALGFYVLAFNLHASCPDTTVRCKYYEYKYHGQSYSYKIVFAGYLFGGQSVPSFWHWQTLACHPLHHSQTDLINMCGEIYPICTEKNNCMALYKPFVN